MPVTKPARYWIGTVPKDLWIFPSPLPESIAYCKGQEEAGTEGGYRHYQVLAVFKSAVRLSAVRRIFAGHWESSRSVAANEYVWKDDTRIPDTQFELGSLPLKRNSKVDWDVIRRKAQEGDLQAVPPDIYIRCYNQLKRISSDHAQCPAMERECYVYWGRTATGKSRRAWDEAGLEAYAKDPQTKWWDGYQGT